jgi:hypothetical protein
MENPDIPDFITFQLCILYVCGKKESSDTIRVVVVGESSLIRDSSPRMTPLRRVRKNGWRIGEVRRWENPDILRPYEIACESSRGISLPLRKE